MLFMPESGQRKIVTNGGIVGAASPWTSVTSGGTTNTYGTVTELISAANNVQDSWGIEVAIFGSGASAVASEAACDILIGGATDDVLISSLLCGYCYASGLMRYFFPIFIPQGLRIAAQISNVRTSIAHRVGVWLYGGGNPPFRVGRKVTTYGTKANNSRGQAITPTASGGAASVTQLTAASDEDHFYFLPGFQPEGDTTITPAGWTNIGVGAGASVEDRLGTWWFSKDTTESGQGPVPTMGAERDVPAGTRLSLLASGPGANDAGYGGLIYAVS